MKRLRSLALPLVVFVGLAVYYGLGLADLPAHPVESRQLSLSREAWADPIGSAGQRPEGIVVPLLLGLGWRAAGFAPEAISTVPETALLAAARFGPALLTALAAALLSWVGARLGGWPTGLLAAAAFGLHPLILLDGRRLFPETIETSLAMIAAAALVLWGRDLHRAWRRQRNAAAAFEVETSGPPQWDSSQMRIETARERDQQLVPNSSLLEAPDARQLPAPNGQIEVYEPRREVSRPRRAVMPSPVEAPRWQSRQMRVGTSRPPEPIPGSTRPGHRLTFAATWRAGWLAALLAGLAVGVSLAGGPTGVAVLVAALVVVVWVVWPRVAPGQDRLRAVAAFGALLIGSALLTGFALSPMLWRDPVGGLQTQVRLRQENVLAEGAADPTALLADPITRLQAMTRTIFFEAPQVTDNTASDYVPLPWTAAWPQPWAGIVGLSVFGLGLAAAIRRSRRGGVAAIVALSWLVSVMILLMVTAGLDHPRVFLALMPPLALLAAYGVTALVDARGDLRELGRR